MFGRKRMQNHRQQFMSELGESAHALRRAAGHFAQGTAETFSPTYDRARHIAGRGWESTRERVSPMYKQVREGASSMKPMGPMGPMRSMKAMKAMKAMKSMQSMSPRQLKKEAAKRGRRRMLRGLLLAGAAVGAASAAVARRRRQEAEWAEYEPTAGFDESRYAESKYGQRSAKQKVASGAASMADSLSDRAGRIADSLHERSAAMKEKAGGEHHDTGPVGASTVPIREPSGGPSVTGPSTAMGGSSASMMGSGNRNQPMSAPRERLGDPALDFPEER